MTAPAQPVGAALYRREALEFRRHAHLGSVRVFRSRLATIAAVLATLAALALILLVIFMPFSARSRVKGQLVPARGIAIVAAPGAGTVAELYVKEGDRVTRGTPLALLHVATLTDRAVDAQRTRVEQLTRQRAIVLAQIAEADAHARTRRDQLAGKRRLIEDTLASRAGELELLEERLAVVAERLGRLERSGAVAAVDLSREREALIDLRGRRESMRREIGTARIAVADVDRELAELTAGATKQRNDLRRDESALAADLEAAQADAGRVVPAGVDGVVAGVTPVIGQSVAAGETILRILPETSELIGRLWVSSEAVGQIEPGEPVALRYAAFPYQRYGTFRGRVLRVVRVPDDAKAVPVLSAQATTQPMYRVEVALEAQTVPLGPDSVPLLPGMLLDADITTDRRTVLDWILYRASAVRG